MLTLATSLWREKEAWFSYWIEGCYAYYISELQDAWYEGDEPLDYSGFVRRLRQPAGIDFELEAGELRYLISGTDEDLVGDHFLEAVGSSLKPSEYALT